MAAAYIGCASWSLPLATQGSFSEPGSHLQRYATRLNACEINSSFHRIHRPATYRRWADVYLRLHGSPRMYYSAYEPPLLAALASRIAHVLRDGSAVWCIFDNTAGSAATDNALVLQQALQKELA